MSDQKTIYDIDPNFRIGSTLDKTDVVFRDIRQSPFSIHGVFFADGKFRRMPESVARAVSEGVYCLHANAAGGRVRFRTDSPYIAIAAELANIGKMPHFALTGSAGFDLYVREDGTERYAGTFTPPFAVERSFTSVIEFETQRLREITIDFPLYTDVCTLLIGLAEDAALQPPHRYRVERPVIYYGSSITQGGCASRPGSSYQAVISRRLDCDYRNLGFSGAAKAEPEMIDYLKKQDMSLFVCDYDHNAPSPEHLQQTHETLFRAVRETHPDLPVILMSRPRFFLNADARRRLEIIRQTYERALVAGDRHVWLLTGPELMQYAGNEGTVDGIHPTDYGFASMARTLGDLMQTIPFG